jgi:23S rRNA pseudouridine2457 synthase
MKDAKLGQFRYFIIYKPYGMLSQFTQEVPGQLTLKALSPPLPPGIYPVGRLDKDSEGLLILSDDASLNQKLLNPKHRHPRTYLVQVEGIPSPEAIRKLQQGLIIKTEKGPYQTLPAAVALLAHAPDLPKREPPVRYRASVPDSWLEITLTEGKNRQVRRMCAAVGYPVLRLVRVRIAQVKLGKMIPGKVVECEKSALFQQLGLS